MSDIQNMSGKDFLAQNVDASTTRRLDELTGRVELLERKQVRNVAISGEMLMVLVISYVVIAVLIPTITDVTDRLTRR